MPSGFMTMGRFAPPEAFTGDLVTPATERFFIILLLLGVLVVLILAASPEPPPEE